MRLPAWTRIWTSKTRISSSHEANYLNNLRANKKIGDVSARIVIKPSPWRPIYLSSASLAAFSVVFLACLASIQTVLAISNHHVGLPGDDGTLHRIFWSYSPTAILTLVASFWTRVENQTKTTAPWFSMAQGNTLASQSVLLDYISQFVPFSIISALRHKDYTVAAATVGSLLLRVLLVLATSLITLSPARVKYDRVRLSLNSEFVNSPDGLTANGSLATANFASIMNLNTSLPQGVSDTYAYQLIESDLPDMRSTLNTTVDGFIGGLECEPANSSVNDLIWDYKSGNYVPLAAGSCTFNYFPGGSIPNEPMDGDLTVGIMGGPCNGSKDERRLGIIAAILASQGEGVFTIAKSNFLMCTPTYQILPLDLSAQGPHRLVRPSSSSGRNSRILSNVHPWDIMDSHLDQVSQWWPYASLGAVNISNQTVWFDPWAYRAYQFANRSGNPPTFSAILEDPKRFTEFFSNYYQQYSALLAHTSLMQPASISSTGSVDEVTSRFLVQRIVANFMTGVLVVCLMMGIFIWTMRTSTKLALPQSPTTIIGLSVCLSSSCAMVKTLSGMGNSGRDTLKAMLDGCHYRSCWDRDNDNFEVLVEERLPANDDLEMWPPERTIFKPLTLSPSARLTTATILLAIIVSLEVTLRLSQRGQGLGNVPLNNDAIGYLWTALPGLIFTLISMYCSSADFDTRSLVPFLHLARDSKFQSSVSLDLVNKHTFLLLYEELKTKSFEALASTLAVILTSFLTIFSTGLFTSAVVTRHVSTQLSVARPIWYNTKGTAAEFGWPDHSLGSAALILTNNMSYPSFTYEDLILPTLKVDETFLSAHSNTSAIEFSTTLLAARPSFSQCRIFNSSQIRVSSVALHIDSEECHSGVHGDSWNLRILSGAPDAYFAVGGGSWGDKACRGCSQRLWAWGRWSSSAGQQGDLPRVSSVSALACNESVETVEVEAVLFGPDLSINPSRPPIPHQSAASSVDAQGWFKSENEVTIYEPYSGLPQLSTNTPDRLFDTFFTLLTTSRYAIPLDMLGNQSHASTVAEAIKFHHRIIAAQSIANLYRVPEEIRIRRDWEYKIVPGTNNTSAYNATSSVPSDRPRVVQNEFSTRVLQSLLAGTLICLLVNWYLIHLAGGCGVVPRSPNTIASVAALLADGNLIELSRSVNCQSLDLQEIRDHLGRDTVFRLGWYDISGRGEKVYCIHADHGSRMADSSQHESESEEAATQDVARL